MSQSLAAGVAPRIAHYRKLNGWSAQRLADNTGGLLSRASIASIESGRRKNLRLDQFLAICLALRIPPVALLVDLEEPFAPASVRFPGSAPSPLDEQAPVVSLARWLSGVGEPTTPAAKRVALIIALTDDYVTARDAYELDTASRRLRPEKRLKRPDRTLGALQGAEAALVKAGIAPP